MKLAAVVLTVVFSLSLGGVASADSISDMGSQSLQMQQAMDQKSQSETKKSNTIKSLAETQRAIIGNIK